MALRADLVGLLAASLPAGALRTGVTVTSVDAGAAGRQARVVTSAGDLDADLVVAADGIGSRHPRDAVPRSPRPAILGLHRVAFRRARAGHRPVEPAETWGTGAVFGTFPLAGGAASTATPARPRRPARVTTTRPPS